MFSMCAKPQIVSMIHDAPCVTWEFYTCEAQILPINDCAGTWILDRNPYTRYPFTDVGLLLLVILSIS